MIKIGIMGGTFDPIHYGHLVTAEAVRQEFGLDKVVFVPSGSPPHKKKITITPAEHRCAMVELSIATNPFFSLSRVEVDRQGYSYAADTVDSFIAEYGDEAEIYFITGADAIKAIMSWYKIDTLMKKCKFIAATRPGYDFDHDYHLPPKYRERIRPLGVPALAISSSKIRDMIGKEKSVKYLVPEPVEAYIKDHKLYLPSEDKKK